MVLRAALYALAAGLAAFLLVGVAVTELAASQVEFSLFLGIPAGLVAGAITATTVLFTAEGDDPRRRRLGFAVGTFGVVFLLGLLVVALVLRQGVVVAIVAGLALGILGAAGRWLRG